MYNPKPHLFYLLDKINNSNMRLSTQHIAPHHKNKGQSLVTLPNVVLPAEQKSDFLKSDFLVQYRSLQRTKCKTLTSIQVNSINESPAKNKSTTIIKSPTSQISCQNYIKLLGMINSQNQEINETYQSGIKGLDQVVKRNLRPKKFKIKQQKSDFEYEEFKETQSQAKRLTYVEHINDDISSHQSNHPSAYEKSQLQIEITKQELQFGGRKHKLSQYLDKWTLWYQQKHREEIHLLKSSLTVFIDKLSDLSNIWKNPKRVRKLVDKLLKPELVKLIFDDQFHIGLGINLLLKQFQFKETIYTQERQILINKYNFNYQRDIDNFCNQLGIILHDANLQELTTMKERIQDELIQVKQIESKIMNGKFSQKHIDVFRPSQLSYYDPFMTNQTRDNMMDRAERLYGNFQNPTQQNREINNRLKLLLDQLKIE